MMGRSGKGGVFGGVRTPHRMREDTSSPQEATIRRGACNTDEGRENATIKRNDDGTRRVVNTRGRGTMPLPRDGGRRIKSDFGGCTITQILHNSHLYEPNKDPSTQSNTTITITILVLINYASTIVSSTL